MTTTEAVLKMEIDKLKAEIQALKGQILTLTPKAEVQALNTRITILEMLVTQR
ncbi:hypothetical protein OCD65_27960 [Bacillus paranthracis]|uniref:hypothetical protein n=1 Tax=Bacillus cereus group TaxID=86661 RepID=UPI001F59DCCE|nr:MULTISPECIES: hypothetical protein [Bacillus cereus group]MCU5020518.1 hypothetical protein [Bacillus paranthracis]